MSDRQRHGFVLLLVAGLIAASLFAILSQSTVLGLDLKGGVQLVYQGEPTPRRRMSPRPRSAARSTSCASRIDQLGVTEPEIQTSGSNQISVGLPDVKDTARAVNEVGTTARLYFFDWEANVLTPSGKTVASQLATQDPTALEISQGLGQLGAGDAERRQHAAVPGGEARLQQPKVISKNYSRIGPQYYLFGAPGSAACPTHAKDQRSPDRGAALPAGRARQRDLSGDPAAGEREPGRAAARRGERLAGPGAGRPAGHGRAAGVQPDRPDDQAHQPSGAVLRAQGQPRR